MSNDEFAIMMLGATLIWLLLPIWICVDIAKWIVKKYGYALYDEEYAAKYKDSLFSYNSLITINIFWILYPIAYFITKFTAAWIWDGAQPITFRGIIIAFAIMSLFYWKVISPFGFKLTLWKFLLIRFKQFIDHPENFTPTLNQEEYDAEEFGEDNDQPEEDYDLLDELIDINYKYKDKEVSLEEYLTFLNGNFDDFYTYLDTQNVYEREIVQKIIKLIFLHRRKRINNTQLVTYLNKLCKQLEE